MEKITELPKVKVGKPQPSRRTGFSKAVTAHPAPRLPNRRRRISRASPA